MNTILHKKIAMEKKSFPSQSPKRFPFCVKLSDPIFFLGFSPIVN
jgi:hypothetical protein